MQRKTYRKHIIAKMPDDRWDVFETKEDLADRRPRAENFQTLAMAMCWLDEVGL